MVIGSPPLASERIIRNLIAASDKRYIRRDKAGRIRESDDVSRSHFHDRLRIAKAAAKPGHGNPAIAK